ncbi:toprim domain-containing protein [Candidatus Enterovibrio escicola]|uniref:toprim domain-containing protein n=1 Tax=Candidatus Enterovibrio escicola TaxID=1927127 RepID=UPI0012381250|nr:toprim domain-containing protein [Candidatus Enterovibrio escacola]
MERIAMSFISKFKQPHDSTPAISPILSVLIAATEYYQYHLNKDDLAKRYLREERGFDDATIEKFQMGLSPNGFNQLTSQKNNQVWQARIQRSLDKKMDRESLSNIAIDLMELSGLLRTNSEGSFTDRFRGRIVMPIKDENGNTISFGGRVFNSEFNHPDAPKYLNGSDTLCFKKRDVVFGLHLLDKSKEYSCIYLTEGYMDVASMSQFGVDGAVCGMGTSITESQLEKIFSYTNHICFCYDGDKAGKKAATRAATVILPLLSGSRNASFAFLPDGEDPDSLLRQGKTQYTQMDYEIGREHLLHSLDAAEPIESVLESIAILNCEESWSSNPSLVIAHLLHYVSSMPANSQVANEIRTKIQIHANQKSRSMDGLSNEQMINFVRNMS